MRILYGGSVKRANAREPMAYADIDGSLRGVASLRLSPYAGIVEAI